MKLAELRRQIDVIDREIVRLLNERTKRAVRIGQIKRAENIPVFVPGREHEVLERLRTANNGPLSDSSLQHIYREIMSAARAIEGGVTIACVAASAEAARSKFGDSVAYVRLASAAACQKAVGKKAQLAVLPAKAKQDGAIDVFSHGGKNFAVLAEQK